MPVNDVTVRVARLPVEIIRAGLVRAGLVRVALVRVGLAALCAAPGGAPALAADYFAGKTIELVVGADAGGGYDIYARTLARHINRHIPGAPAIVVKNMPGAGSTRAGIYMSTVAAKDGTSIAAMMPGAIMDPLLEDRPNAQFDPAKVIYIGTADSGVRICTTFQNSRIKTFEDAQRGKTVLGASAAGGSTRDYAHMHNKTAGTRFEVVSGYQGTVDIALAMERGEVDGLCGWDWSSVKSQKSDWVRDRKLNVLVQVSLAPLAELSDRGVPHIFKFITNDRDRAVAELVISQQVFQRSYILPPGTRQEAVDILRAAFSATMADAQFLADAERMKLSTTPLPGDGVQDVIRKLYATPKDLVERAKLSIKP
jgi:tripartite-type tricarboxylate transporter receptor subunit TctC